MLEPQNKTIDGVDFQFLPMDPFLVIRLEKRIAPLLLPIISGIKGFSMQAELSEVIDFETLSRALREAISEMADSDFEFLVRSLLSHVTTPVQGAGVVTCDGNQGKSVFVGNSMLLYKVAVEAMRFNKFIPFAVLEGGDGMAATVSSFVQNASQKKTGLKLER